MARRSKATERQLEELLQVAADAAEELGHAGLAEVLRLVGPSTDIHELSDRVHYREYYDEVKAVAEAVVDDVVRADLPLEEAAREMLLERVHEAVDGHQFVIYTKQNLDVLVASSNWLAAEEEGLIEGDVAHTLAVLAYGAMNRDVMEEAENLLEEHEVEDDEE